MASPCPEEATLVHKRSHWTVSKGDFFPGESFKSWSACESALSQTCFRFKAYIMSCSDDANELGEVRQQSKNDMKRCLSWWGLIWFRFGAVIRAGIFVLTGQEAHNHAGPGIVLSYVLSGLSLMLSVFCCTEFAVEIPVAECGHEMGKVFGSSWSSKGDDRSTASGSAGTSLICYQVCYPSYIVYLHDDGSGTYREKILCYVVTIPSWFFSTMGIWILLSQQNPPKFWGVPCVPWLPSLSIAANVFLMGSLKAEAFLRFSLCTVISKTAHKPLLELQINMRKKQGRRVIAVIQKGIT
ncbi:hypothetical protein Cgig2_030714 [Carnegiea gigantea]|uniref:Cationic amino acid transporter C-terminal domain-containing protein n=1 Tax=Carnegiea gigantea TaxID=171969 RepID=A0A9Q1K6S2_9CARY|nr:hypothetical protein Cgig2_030714 [Carnegiea gigantea]